MGRLRFWNDVPSSDAYWQMITAESNAIALVDINLFSRVDIYAEGREDTEDDDPEHHVLLGVPIDIETFSAFSIGWPHETRYAGWPAHRPLPLNDDGWCGPWVAFRNYTWNRYEERYMTSREGLVDWEWRFGHYVSSPMDPYDDDWSVAYPWQLININSLDENDYIDLAARTNRLWNRVRYYGDQMSSDDLFCEVDDLYDDELREVVSDLDGILAQQREDWITMLRGVGDPCSLSQLQRVSPQALASSSSRYPPSRSA